MWDYPSACAIAGATELPAPVSEVDDASAEADAEPEAEPDAAAEADADNADEVAEEEAEPEPPMPMFEPAWWSADFEAASTITKV